MENSKLLNVPQVSFFINFMRFVIVLFMLKFCHSVYKLVPFRKKSILSSRLWNLIFFLFPNALLYSQYIYICP